MYTIVSDISKICIWPFNDKIFSSKKIWPFEIYTTFTVDICCVIYCFHIIRCRSLKPCRMCVLILSYLEVCTIYYTSLMFLKIKLCQETVYIYISIICTHIEDMYLILWIPFERIVWRYQRGNQKNIEEQTTQQIPKG